MLSHIRLQVATLRAYLGECDALLDDVSHALGAVHGLENMHSLVSRKTGELHQACELLVEEQVRLVHTHIVKSKR